MYIRGQRIEYTSPNNQLKLGVVLLDYPSRGICHVRQLKDDLTHDCFTYVDRASIVTNQ